MTTATRTTSPAAGAVKALVTGASAGIGRAFATSLAEAGYSVTAVARHENSLVELMAELGPGHGYLVADLASPAGLLSAAALLAESPHTLLVNNS
ncbi:SDR family NAD(P)-dependent oxidoreductase [Nocardia sp. GCM10030253]|uniref:SDR family NAD(P)-dependent oxidoreductase n=1 Tax=Nocardia sp. GCM10030253 TaxID=3273404 RepID=UPI00362E8B1B